MMDTCIICRQQSGIRQSLSLNLKTCPPLRRNGFSLGFVCRLTPRETHLAHTFEYQKTRTVRITLPLLAERLSTNCRAMMYVVLIHPNDGIIALYHLIANKLPQDGLTEVNMELCFVLFGGRHCFRPASNGGQLPKF